MIEQLHYFVYFSIGLFISFVLDTYWWLKPSFSKYEKGVLVIHEHYHFGIELLIVSIVLAFILPQTLLMIPITMTGIGIGFIIAEWRQIIEIKKKKPVMGHPFAYGSSHFEQSTVFGLLLFIPLIVGLLTLIK